MSPDLDLDDDEHEELDGNVVRPYMLTRGRTRSTSTAVAMESLVERIDAAADEIDTFEPAAKRIWDVLTERMSAAEISAHLELPLGVVFVLVGDLAGSGVLHVHETTDTDDIQLVRRLIDGVSAL